MESFKLCKVKTGYVWNVLLYTGEDTELKNEDLGTDLLQATEDCVYPS
jgi:hypothetical protein